MGKTYCKIEHSDNTSRSHDITRGRFIDAVQAGIDAALAAPSGDSFPVDRAKQIAQEATTMDACTWKAADSCGCPMTYLGLVELVPYGESDDPGANPAWAFATAYDTYIGNVLENRSNYDGGAVTLTITDTPVAA